MSEAEYLTANGWREAGETPWRWSHPTASCAWYREADAVALQRSADRDGVKLGGPGRSSLKSTPRRKAGQKKRVSG